MAFAHAPKIGYKTLSKHMSLTSAGTLSNIGFNEDVVKSAAKLSPSEKTLKNFVRELGADIILLTSEEIKDK